MGVLKFLIIASIALFPLGEVIRIQLAESVFVKPIDVTSGIAFILWMILIVKNKKIRQAAKENYLAKPVLLFITIAFTSLLINSNLLNKSEFLTSFLYLVRWSIYAGIYFVISSFDNKFKKRIITILVIAGALTLAGGFVQYAFYQNLRNLYYLGWDEHMHRLFSSFLDPNFAGAFFVLYTLFLGGIFAHQHIISNQLIKRGAVILIILSIFTIFLTHSRSAYISFLFGTSVSLLLLGRAKWILGLVAIFIVMITIFSRNFHIENINLFRTASSEARLESAKDALKIIEKNPVFGVGFNAYRYAQIRYGLRDEERAQISHADAGTDNSFLFVLATTGIIGLVSFIFIFYSILKKAFLLNKRGSIFSIVVISSLTALFVNSLFINSLFFAPIMFFLWILAAVMDYK